MRKKLKENILVIFRREQVAWAKASDNLSGFLDMPGIWLKQRVAFPPLFSVFLFCLFEGFFVVLL